MERGLQVKSDVVSRSSEANDFPRLCDACLGENPYIRMQRSPYGSKCKMCDRPYTEFKWRPGRGVGYRRTEVCSDCSKIKNICQTCILDLEFGLPSQLRDAVLSSSGEDISAAVSETNSEFIHQSQLARLANGEDPWSNSRTPNQALLEIARTAATHRGSSKLRIKEGSASSKRQCPDDSLSEKQSSGHGHPANQSEASELNILLPKDFHKEDPPTKTKKPRPPPPKPAGPPPLTAFKNLST